MTSDDVYSATVQVFSSMTGFYVTSAFCVQNNLFTHGCLSITQRHRFQGHWRVYSQPIILTRGIRLCRRQLKYLEDVAFLRELFMNVNLLKRHAILGNVW